jgi:hypothetical protein
MSSVVAVTNPSEQVEQQDESEREVWISLKVVHNGKEHALSLEKSDRYTVYVS